MQTDHRQVHRTLANFFFFFFFCMGWHLFFLATESPPVVVAFRKNALTDTHPDVLKAHLVIMAQLSRRRLVASTPSSPQETARKGGARNISSLLPIQERTRKFKRPESSIKSARRLAGM
jgi:hypothetical protein